MIEIESITNWIAVVANIAVAIFILFKGNKLSGIILAVWFLILGIQFYLLIGSHEVVKFEMINGNPELIMPLWYKVFIAARSIFALLAPLALLLIAKQAVANKGSSNA